MGSAQLPRIYFTGYQYWNPNTVNNNDYGSSEPYGINTWDPPQADFNYDYLESQGVQTDPQIPPFLRKNIHYEPPSRQLPPAEWGLYGGQECGFVTETAPVINNPLFSKPPNSNTLTTGYTDTGGNYGKDDPWIGQPMQLNASGSEAKLVDVNPMSFWSSQVFFDTFVLGTADGFSATPVARMHSRLISTAKRNYNSTNDLVIAAEFGAMFQSCFDHHSINPQGQSGRIWEQFQAGFDSGAAGLMLRYTAYATLYFQGSVFNGMPPGNRYPMLDKLGELYEQYAANPNLPRPVSRAYSRVAGWIGLWMPGELVSIPGGRFLIPFPQGAADGKQAIAVTPSNLEPNQYEKPPQLPPNTDAPIHAPQPLGPAYVEAATDPSGNPTRLTLDLGNTFPERDSSGVKALFGTAQLGLELSDGTVKWVPQNVSYDQAKYEQFGGLVDLPCGGITASDLVGGTFFLQVDSGQQGSTQPVRALVETFSTSQTDTRGMYAEQPNPNFSDGDAANPGPGMPSTAPTCELQVRFKGWAPQDFPLDPKPQMKLEWQALDYQLNPYAPGELPIDILYKNPSGSFVPFQGAIDVPGDGSVEVQIVSKGTAIPNLIFLPYSTQEGTYSGAPFLPPVGIGSSYYTVIKCLSWYNSIADWFDRFVALNPPVDTVNQIVWDLVFRTYFLGFPTMDWIKNPQVFCQYAKDIHRVTDPELFDGASYMPVTRTWAAGQRHIMNSYVAYLAQMGPNPCDKETAAVIAATPLDIPQPEGLVEARSESPTGETLGHG